MSTIGKPDMNRPEIDRRFAGIDRYTFLSGQETIQETIQETTQETTQEKILALLRKSPHLTRKRMAELIGISDTGIKYHLDKLRTQGIIRHIGPTKAGHWDVLK